MIRDREGKHRSYAIEILWITGRQDLQGGDGLLKSVLAASASWRLARW